MPKNLKKIKQISEPHGFYSCSCGLIEFLNSWGGGAWFARCPGQRPQGRVYAGGAPLGRMGLARCLQQGAGWQGSRYLYMTSIL
jgi:hypothetical protein